MKRKNAIHKTWLYKHRYFIAITILIIIAGFLSVYRFWDIPAGLTESEINSARIAGNLSFDTLFKYSSMRSSDFANLPWSILQALSISLFGLNAMAIRLPAVLLTIGTIAILIVLIRRLTKPSLSMMGGLIIVTSAFTIGMARSGVPAVMTTFLLSALLLTCHIFIARDKKSKGWSLIVAGVIAGLLSYMSGGFFALLAVLLAAILHPRIRLELLRNKSRLGTAIGCYLLVISPLVYGLTVDFLSPYGGDLKNQLLYFGVPSIQKIRDLAHYFGGFSGDVASGLITPMFTIVSITMAMIGLLRTARSSRQSIRFYTIISIVIVSIILISCRPEFAYLLFIPTIILQVFCLGWLTDLWYGLFPINPYARVFAILPLAILIGSLSSVDISRYFNSVNYNKDIVYQMDQTLSVVNKLIKTDDKQNYLIIVPVERASFYRLLERTNSRVKVIDDGANSEINKWLKKSKTKDRLVILNGVELATKEKPDITKVKDLKLDRIMTGWISHDSVVLRSYHK